MRTIPAALTWELFARTRWQLLLMLCAASALPMLLYTAIALQMPKPFVDPAKAHLVPADLEWGLRGIIDTNEPAFIIMHVMLIQINMFVFGSGVMTAMGPMSRLYGYPARTATLVMAQLLPAVGCMIAEMALSTMLLNAVFDVRWPVLGPALFAAVAMTGVMAVAWWMEKSAWLPLSVGVAAAGFGLWFKTRYGPLFDMPSHYWTDFTLGDAVSLLILGGVSVRLAVWAVARNRQGVPPVNLGVLAWLQKPFFRPEMTFRTLSSPTESQLWYEWNRKGWVMPMGVVIGLSGGMLFWAIFSRDPKFLVEGLFQGGGILMGLVGFVGGLMFGHCGSSDQDLTMSQFLATRPMGNSQLARLMLWNAAKSAGTAASVWALVLCLIVAPLLVSGIVNASSLDAEIQSIWWWWLPASFLAPWVIGAGLGAVALTGRTQPFLGIAITVLTTGIIASFVIGQLLTKEQQQLFWQITFALLGVATVIITGSLFLKARGRGLLDSQTAAASLVVWIALLAMLIGSQVVRPELPWLVVVFLCGCLSLLVMPLAATPLALAWNRTR